MILDDQAPVNYVYAGTPGVESTSLAIISKLQVLGLQANGQAEKSP